MTVASLLPPMRAGERTVYPAAARHPKTELLVRALVSENRSIAWHVGRPATIRSLFAVHVAKEDYVVLPALDRPRTRPAVLVSREPTLVSRG